MNEFSRRTSVESGQPVTPRNSVLENPRSQSVGGVSGEITVPHAPADEITEAPAEKPVSLPTPKEVHEIPVRREATVTTPPRLEIRHYPQTTRHRHGHDAVVNTRHPDPELAKLAGELAAGGISDSWVRIPNRHGKDLRVDSGDNPLLFAKTRQGSEAAKYREQLARAQTFHPVLRQIRASQHAGYQAIHSVLSEMYLAPRIREIINNDDVQEGANNQGFEEIRFIEPLVGLSDHATGRKTVVYPYQAGVGGEDIYRGDDPLARSHGERLLQMSIVVRTQLEAHGITAFDIDGSQFIVDGEKLYFIDAEGFHRTPNIPPYVPPCRLT